MGYRYQVIVINIDEMSPEEVWRFYNGGANVENVIKEGIMSYSLDVNISHFYGTNIAHFNIVMLAYKLMNLFKGLVLRQKDKRRVGKWIRKKIIMIAWKLIKIGRSFILKLQEDWAYQVEYSEADRRLQGLTWVT